MRNRVLHGIFHGRAKGSSGSSSGNQVQLPFSRNGAQPVVGGNPAVQAFSGLVGSGFGTAALLGTGAPTQLSGASGAVTQIPEIFGQVATNLNLLRAVTEAQSTAVGANTAAVTSNTTQKASSQILSQAGQAAGGLLGGFTALPLISGIAKLFGLGGNSQPQQQPLQRYVGPAPIAFDATAQSKDGSQFIQSAGYDEFGNERVNRSPIPTVPNYSPLLASTRANVADTEKIPNGVTGSSGLAATGQGSLAASAQPAQVIVNVQAMDSRSFLDRSHDIAQAVREAMLNMHSINDVVNDL